MDMNRAPLRWCCAFSTRGTSFFSPPPDGRPRPPSTGTPRTASSRCSATTARGRPCRTRTGRGAASRPRCWGPGTCWCPHWRGGVGRPTSTACGASAARSPPAPGWSGPLWRSASAAHTPGWRRPFLEKETRRGTRRGGVGRTGGYEESEVKTWCEGGWMESFIDCILT